MVLIDNEPIRFEEDQIVDIILSPKYYWVKKENLPVRYARQAKAYANSTFEDIIPQGHYNYLAKKDEDGFWLYAYDDSYILNEIEKLGIKPQQIGKVFFAQNELYDVDTPIKLNKNEALIRHDESLIKVPRKMVKNSIEFSDYFQSHNLSNFSVKLNKFSQMIDFKLLYTLMFALLALIIFYGVQFAWLGKVGDELSSKKESISKRYKMPSTSLQTKALMNQLDKKMSNQQKLREKFYHISKLPISGANYIQSIKYNNKKFSISLNLKDQSQTQKIQSYLQKHFKMENVNKKGDIATFEVRYD